MSCSNKSLRWLPFLLVVAIVASMVGLGGCGQTNKEVQNYIDVALPSIDKVASRLNELRKFFTLPLGDQGGMKDALAAFRKTLSESQKTQDETHAPQPCRDLERLWGQSLDHGRQIADMLTPFADYFGDLAPVAKEVSEMMAILAQLQSGSYIASGVVTQSARASSALTRFQTIIAPQVFNAVNAEFGAFLQTTINKLQQASQMIEKQGVEEAPEEPPGYSTGPQSTQPRSGKKSSVQSLIGEIIEDWERTSGKIVSLLDGVRQTTGVTPKQAEFDSAILQIQAQVQNLEKQYKVHVGK